MKVTYLSADDVNRFLVRLWAARCGVRVVTPNPAAQAAGAVALDFDFLPVEVRRRWVSNVLADGHDGPVLVTGHGITDVEAAALRARGAVVSRGRIRAGHLRRWLRRIAAVPA